MSSSSSTVKNQFISPVITNLQTSHVETSSSSGLNCPDHFLKIEPSDTIITKVKKKAKELTVKCCVNGCYDHSSKVDLQRCFSCSGGIHLNDFNSWYRKSAPALKVLYNDLLVAEQAALHSDHTQIIYFCSSLCVQFLGDRDVLKERFRALNAKTHRELKQFCTNVSIKTRLASVELNKWQLIRCVIESEIGPKMSATITPKKSARKHKMNYNDTCRMINLIFSDGFKR